ncbi:MAG: hypothetical protein CMN72_13920 [Sphingomonas sp.]|nr:hypothetical protein [Sphingomonas sp.]
MRYILPLAILPLCLSACQSGTPISADQPESDNISDASVDQPLSPGARPVRIGENGANFAACGARGVATLAEDRRITVRAAPFDEAEARGTLAAGQRMYICTRSIDQRWLGVVIPAENGDMVTGEDRCGVEQRVERPQAYSGSCLSGWVPNALVRLTAQ